jgi:hypothetical protein
MINHKVIFTKRVNKELEVVIENMVYIETFYHHIPSYVQVDETLTKSKCKNCNCKLDVI